jgi:hemolysin III
VAGGPLFADLSPAGFRLIVAGGCLYTIGVGFFLWERLPFHTTIWHSFVLTASALVYFAVILEFWGRATLA